jgi:hypothetical protein
MSSELFDPLSEGPAERTGGVEIYGRNRFFPVTGQVHCGACDIAELADVAVELYRFVKSRGESRPGTVSPCKGPHFKRFDCADPRSGGWRWLKKPRVGGANS